VHFKEKLEVHRFAEVPKWDAGVSATSPTPRHRHLSTGPQPPFGYISYSYYHFDPDRVRGHCPDSRYLNDIWILCICVRSLDFNCWVFLCSCLSTSPAIATRISIWCDEFIMRTKAQPAADEGWSMPRNLGIANYWSLKKRKLNSIKITIRNSVFLSNDLDV